MEENPEKEPLITRKSILMIIVVVVLAGVLLLIALTVLAPINTGVFSNIQNIL